MMPNEYPTRLDICDGKYTLIIDMDTGRAECLRYGEKWRDLIGDKMVLALFDELVEARAQAEAARAEVKALRAKVDAMERQEPVVEVQWAAGIPNGILDFISTDGYLPELGDKLYALPGAKRRRK